MRAHEAEQDQRPTGDERERMSKGARTMGEFMGVWLADIAPPLPARVVLTKAERRALARAGAILDELTEKMNELDGGHAYDPSQTYMDATLAGRLIDEVLEASAGRPGQVGYMDATSDHVWIE